MAKLADEERAYLNVLRVVIISFLKGTAPILAVEAARRATPGHVRPTFQELEEGCRGHSSAPAASETPPSETPPSDTPPEAQAASTGG
jgi:chemotaxis protein MotA